MHGTINIKRRRVVFVDCDLIVCVCWCVQIISLVKAAVPLQACTGPEGCRKLRLPDFVTTAQDGGKVVSLTHRPRLPPGNAPGTHFC